MNTSEGDSPIFVERKLGQSPGVPGNLQAAFETVRGELLQRMQPGGFWEGRLSSSPLATATAVSALALANSPLPQGERESDVARIASGVAWLAGTQNADGGWGDTTASPSNLATTLLAIAALRLAKASLADTLEKAGEYVSRCVGDTPDGRFVNRPSDFGLDAGCRVGRAQRAPPIASKFLVGLADQRLASVPVDPPYEDPQFRSTAIVAALQREYGADRTFAIPILMNCALAGLVDWQDIPGLPFELAVLPHACYKALRLHVVSYALPALIAIGLMLDRRHPPASALRRCFRKLVTPRVLQKLRQIQPEHGGFLEATPLTSFVAMAMLPLFGGDDPVVAKCLQFLRGSQRCEGAWPIDTDLSLWLTTAAVTALSSAGQLARIDRDQTARWIAAAQYKVPHPYTHAAPGGWGWTYRPGGVPDVDDTAGAILAMQELGSAEGVAAGVRWLLQLQNGDGGWPTFCRGWGKLPFDTSAPDLTAHALRAIRSAARVVAAHTSRRAIRRGLRYLRASQQADGSWIPLWFGNQAAAGQTNPVLGTARVLRALAVLDREGPATDRGVAYLLRVQNDDGGWGGAEDVVSTVEETALTVVALAPWSPAAEIRTSLFRGVEYLIPRVARAPQPAPIGLYFAHLWYSEELYTLTWALDALGHAVKCVQSSMTDPVNGPIPA